MSTLVVLQELVTLLILRRRQIFVRSGLQRPDWDVLRTLSDLSVIEENHHYIIIWMLVYY